MDEIRRPICGYTVVCKWSHTEAVFFDLTQGLALDFGTRSLMSPAPELV